MCKLMLIVTLLGMRCFAQIFQVESMEEVMEHFKEAHCTTLAVFDIDMTLIQPQEPAFQMANIYKHGDVAKRVIQSLPHEKRDIFFSLTTLSSESVLVDENTPDHLETLSDNGVISMALTSALTGSLEDVSSLEEWKSEDLRSQGIDFGFLLSHLDRIVFFELPSYRGNYPTFLDGIMFTNGSSCSKGKALIAFLRFSGLKPQLVIFSDDKLDHVKDVEAELLAYDPSIQYKGLHFLGALHFPTPHLSKEAFTDRWEEVAARALELK
jgi:hypothetical protein